MRHAPPSSAGRTALLACALLTSAAGAARAQAPAPTEPETQPVLLHARDMARIVRRAYPPAQRHRPTPVVVQVRMQITAAGTVDPSTVVIESSDDPEFGPAAAQVVAQLRFRPATIAGEAVAVWVVLPITFTPPGNGDSHDVQRDNRTFKGDLPPPHPRAD